MNRRIAGRSLRTTAVVPAIALVAAGLAAAGTTGSASAAPSSGSGSVASTPGGEYYINTVAPRAEAAFGSDVKLGKTGKPVSAKQQLSVLEKAKAYDAKHSRGNPVAARQLAKDEAKAIRTNSSPKAIKSKYKNAKTTQTAKLLTILVEFNQQANDDFTDVMVPDGFSAENCVKGNVQNGPTHNKIPNPASSALKDNNSMWVPDFSSEHYNKMLYTKTGITERIRPDLKGPDGKAGVDISGYTMKNMYEEMSKGAYTVSGSATPWVTVPHSEAYYGATTCFKNDEGVWEYGAIQDIRATPTTTSARASCPSTPWRRSPRPCPTSPGPTTTSRTRATSTVTPTCTSPMASSTTSCSSTRARTSRAAAAPRAPTPSGRTPRPSRAAHPSPAPTCG
jgi:immune inhibitor A